MREPDYQPLRGPVIDIYGSFTVAKQQIQSALGLRHPHAIRFQGWPENVADSVEKARALWPSCQFGMCPGVDNIIKRYKQNRRESSAISELVGIARGTADLGIGTLVYDAEGEWKSSDPYERKAFSDIVANALRQVRTMYPKMNLGLTSFGWPVRVFNTGGHTTFPWRAWLPGDLNYFGQTYDRGKGKLARGEEIAVASFNEAIKQGYMAPETIRFPEVQLHHNSAVEIVQVAMTAPTIHLWAAGKDELCDEEGMKAIAALTRLWDEGYWNKVAEFQAANGLDVDGDVGPKTLAALLSSRAS